MAECLTPFYKKADGENPSMAFPCGKCPPCRSRRASGWSFRLIEHDKISLVSHFVTLTYSTAYVPITDRHFLSLRKRDIQLFLKRVRRYHDYEYEKRYIRKTERPFIKYYCCGEYGGKTKRPHYHLIMYNCIPELLTKAWPYGAIHFGTVKAASVGYTLKYLYKETSYIGTGAEWDDREPQFQLMSKGLGLNYLTDNVIKWHETDLLNNMYLVAENGVKIAMPRYYKQKIYTDSDRQAIGAYQAQKIEALTNKLKQQNPSYEWDKLQAAKEAFRKMAIKGNSESIF